MLDDAFRERIGELSRADEGEAVLDAEARQRVLEKVRTGGPGLVRRARRARIAAIALGPLLAAAAVGALLLGWHARLESTGSEASGARAGALAPACASRAVAEGAHAGFVAGMEGRRLELGSVAVAVATPGTVVKLSEASPCRTVLSLDSGTVVVHAKDLGGGELRVHASGGDVVVHGTIFAVTEEAGSLTVEVVVGNVTVTDQNDSHSMSSGQRLLLSAVGAARGSVSADRVRSLRALIGSPEVVGFETLEPLEEQGSGERAAQATPLPRAQSQIAREPFSKAAPDVIDVELDESDESAQESAARPATAPPTDPLTLAEAARRSGDFARARELYRRAADGKGVTAEAAWVALARMELSLGHAAAALDATRRRQERFGQGTLAPEALWIDVRTYRQTGDLARARELSTKLVERWPSSPQARAAQLWLSAR